MEYAAFAPEDQMLHLPQWCFLVFKGFTLVFSLLVKALREIKKKLESRKNHLRIKYLKLLVLIF